MSWGTSSPRMDIMQLDAWKESCERESAVSRATASRRRRGVGGAPPTYLRQCFQPPRSSYQHMMAHVPAPPPVRLHPVDIDAGPPLTRHNRQKNTYDWDDGTKDHPHSILPPVNDQPHPLVGMKHTNREQIRALRARVAAARTERREVQEKVAALTPRGTQLAPLTFSPRGPLTPRSQMAMAMEPFAVVPKDGA